MSWPRLILFGDSHFQHSFSPEESIGSLLADKLQRRCDVVNRGFSGYNTTVAKLILPKVFPNFALDNVAGIVILFGSNDAAMAQAGLPNQHVPLEEFEKNLEDIVAFFTTRGVPKEHIILVSPPPIDVKAWDDWCRSRKISSRRSNKEMEKYAAVMYEAARKHGTLFVDLFENMTSPGTDWKKFLADGLHLSTAGSLRFFDSLWPIVERMLKSIPVNYPDWADIDFGNLSVAFRPDEERE